MRRFHLSLVLGIGGLVALSGSVSKASADTAYCCRDPLIPYRYYISERPCPGNEALGQCHQRYCYNAETGIGWQQKPTIFNCDAPGYNYEISREVFEQLSKQGRVR
jgi:hypothetical protein